MITRRNFIGNGLLTAAAASTVSFSSQARAATHSLKWSSGFPSSHPTSELLRNAFDEIKAASNGEVEIKLFADGQLGSEADTMSQLRNGAIDFLVAAGVSVAPLVSLAGIINVPFAFASYDDVWKAVDGDLGNRIRGKLQDAGLHVFQTFWDNGYRQITSNDKLMSTPNEMSGFKIRVPNSPVILKTFQKLGASPVTMSILEVYTSLQAKVIDGQENPIVQVLSYKFYEVQKYVTQSNHVWDAVFQIANRRRWDALPKDVQALITERINANGILHRSKSRALTEELKVTLQEKGMTFGQADPVLFREKLATAKLYEELKGNFSAREWAALEVFSGKLG